LNIWKKIVVVVITDKFRNYPKMSYQDIINSGDWFSLYEMLKKKKDDSEQAARQRSIMVK
jgi:hypothetical protein